MGITVLDVAYVKLRLDLTFDVGNTRHDVTLDAELGGSEALHRNNYWHCGNPRREVKATSVSYITHRNMNSTAIIQSLPSVPPRGVGRIVARCSSHTS